MNHDFYFDGDNQVISWVIKTENNIAKQFRKHAKLYFEKITDEQSKYVALHVGIFWGIGTFIIKNNDTLNIMTDSDQIYINMINDIQIQDCLLQEKKKFILQLIKQRELKVNFIPISREKNMAKLKSCYKSSENY